MLKAENKKVTKFIVFYAFVISRVRQNLISVKKFFESPNQRKLRLF